MKESYKIKGEEHLMNYRRDCYALGITFYKLASFD